MQRGLKQSPARKAYLGAALRLTGVRTLDRNDTTGIKAPWRTRRGSFKGNVRGRGNELTIEQAKEPAEELNENHNNLRSKKQHKTHLTSQTQLQ